MKNITPIQLAYTIALLLAIGITLNFSLLSLLLGSSLNVLVIVGVFIVTALATFAGLYYALELFLHRKIKLIYKIIRTDKSFPEDKEANVVDMNEDIIDEVGREVSLWATENQAEIEKLKATEEFRREFIGNVSHELKTPLFSIQGYLDTLIDGALYDEDVNMDYLIKAYKNIERLNAIVKDLEIITKHEAGEMTIHYQKFDITALIAEIFEELGIIADSFDIELCFKEGCNIAMNVNADREKIRHVLTNLITNSIKYGKVGGTTWIGLYHMDKNILIEVTDNGIGIEEKHLPRLFERFYRIDTHRSRSQGGSGLGLAIAKHIIEAHNELIHVRSTPDVGTTFGFTLQKG